MTDDPKTMPVFDTPAAARTHEAYTSHCDYRLAQIMRIADGLNSEVILDDDARYYSLQVEGVPLTVTTGTTVKPGDEYEPDAYVLMGTRGDEPVCLTMSPDRAEILGHFVTALLAWRLAADAATAFYSVAESSGLA